MSYRTTRSSGLRQALRRATTAVAAGVLVCGPAAGVAAATGPHVNAPLYSAPADPSQHFLHLSINSVTPQMVEPNSPASVTVTGTVANIGDRDVSDVQVRLQRADPVAEQEQLRTTLRLDQDTYHTVGDFHQVSSVLKEGSTAKFSLSLPLSATTEASLDITEPGVYPMLVNVNGTPDYGGTARLDDARFLVPVIGLPTAGTASPRAPAPRQPQPAPAAAPVPTSLLYPLASTPKLAAGIAGQPPGDTAVAVRLIDDSLAQSLAPGGRLDGMLAALDETVHPGGQAPDVVPDPAVLAGLCVAVDPDLLVTVDAMTRGYLVTSDPADPTATTTPGTGREAATNWLGKLRTLAGSMCTVAMPYAQADLEAVVAVGDPQLASEAALTPADTVNQILGTTAIPTMIWPSTGEIAADTANALPVTAPTTLLLAENATSTGAPAMRLTDVNPLLSATSFDLPAAAALSATGEAPSTPDFVPEDLHYRIDNDSRVARLQDAMGAIAWPMIPSPIADVDAGSTRAQTPAAPLAPPAPVILAPPQLWTVDRAEAAAVLTTYEKLISNGLAIPRTLAEVLDQAKAPNAPAATLVDPAPVQSTDETTDKSRWLTPTEDMRALLPRFASLRGILVDVPNVGFTAEAYLRPLSQDLLRTLSTADRGTKNPREARTAAQSRLGALDASLTDQFESITVLAPGSVYTLASSQSPLLLVAQNNLPIAVRVRLQITAPDGVDIRNYTDYTLPARGSRQIQVPAEIEFSRQIDVRVQLLASDGTRLGEEIHISLQSNAYGNLIPIATAVLGALLLILAGRRAWHRIKGKPDPSDERRPVMTPPDESQTEG